MVWRASAGPGAVIASGPSTPYVWKAHGGTLRGRERSRVPGSEAEVGNRELLLLGGPAWLLAVALGAVVVSRSPAWTGVRVPVEQPLPFSHAHHAGLLQIDCRYCHTTVETNAFAGMPSVHVCLGCHDHVWTGLAAVETLQSSRETTIPVEWLRVHDLPDFASFDHSIHVQKGVGCVACHGRVDRMPQVWKTQPLSMGWCLDCHRQPVPHLQPAFTTSDPDWEYPEQPRELAALARRVPLAETPATVDAFQRALAAAYDIQQRTSCSHCHQ
jgi:hypothetical protein